MATTTSLYDKSRGATRLGTFHGCELIHTFVPHGRFSRRAIVYICARAGGEVAFTQMSSIKRELVEDHEEHGIERLLTIDAIEWVKHRIQRGSYELGGIYTSDLTEADIGGSSRLAA